MCKNFLVSLIIFVTVTQPYFFYKKKIPTLHPSLPLHPPTLTPSPSPSLSLPQLKTTGKLPMQVDGEPWMQAPCAIEIDLFNKQPMLKKAVSGEVRDLLLNALTGGSSLLLCFSPFPFP